jgi:hydroxyacylglutathione hydrolase
MIIKCIPGGSFLTNTYIIADEESKTGILIDPGSQVQEVLEEIENLDLKIDKIVNTHAHIDHAAGVQEAKDALSAKFYIHPKELPVLQALPESALRFPEFGDVEVPEVDEYLEEGDIIQIGSYQARVLHVPGHTWGSICLVIDEHVISGDTLFAGSVGRVDLTGGTSMEELVGSINRKLLTLPPTYIVYPGHGPITKIGIEKQSNPFLGGGVFLF